MVANEMSVCVCARACVCVCVRSGPSGCVCDAALEDPEPRHFRHRWRPCLYRDIVGGAKDQQRSEPGHKEE